MITGNAVLRSAALSAVLLLSACYDDVPNPALARPPDYSPDYAYIKVVSNDGRERRVLVPEACLAPAAPSVTDDGPPRLPPGCANNFNLQRMVARKHDLTHARPISPAPAAPAARAAQSYIEGDKQALGGGVREPAVFSGEKTTVEPTQ